VAGTTLVKFHIFITFSLPCQNTVSFIAPCTKSINLGTAVVKHSKIERDNKRIINEYESVVSSELFVEDYTDE